jgi:nucleoid-associated protein YgaU
VRANYPVFAVIAVVALVVLAVVLGRRDDRPPPEIAYQPPEAASTESPASNVTVPETRDARASFDVVRVAPDGKAVIAGRTEPGAEVTVRAGERVIGRVTADERGEWVLVPERALESGAQELGQEIRVPGEAPYTSKEIVVVVVPERAEAGAAQEQAIVLRPPAPGGASELLQGPTSRQAGEIAGLALKTADYDAAGHVVLSGEAAPGAKVRAYLDNRPIAAGEAGEDGAWRLRPEAPLAPGGQALRIDQLDEEGRVVMRIEVPFERALLTELPLAAGVVVVRPGTNLWRIARAVYGRGNQYTLIFEANRERIRDPDLIYPGQAFAIPEAKQR